MITDVFCKILNKELPADFVMEEKDWIAVHDISPSAPVHVLIIPRKHIAGLQEVQEADASLLGSLLLGAAAVAEKTGIKDKGYRVIINCGQHGGQLVPHLHVHVIGGKFLGSKIHKEE